jgi:hypothetical protein
MTKFSVHQAFQPGEHFFAQLLKSSFPQALALRSHANK